MPAKSSKLLSPEDVRECAKAIEGCRAVSNAAAAGESPSSCSVVSFLVGLEARPKTKAALARVNVYTDTGTVGTCRVMNGQVREIFRRNVTSTEVLKKMLQTPADLALIDDTVISNGSTTQTQQQQSTVPARLELADLGLAILMGERQRLEKHLESLHHDHDEDESTTTTDHTQDAAHMEFEFGFTEEVVEQVDQCLRDIGKLGKNVTCVAINGKGAVLLYGHGGVAYTPDIPKALYHKLKQLKRPNRNSTRPSYVALGSKDRYYVAYHDGTADWKGHKAFDKVVKNLSKPPRSVAFGSTYDTFFIVHHDGSWEWHGKGIPEDLEKKLQDRAERPDLLSCALGPKGEWFLRAQNGRMWWGNIGEELDAVIDELLEGKHYLNFMDFGDDGSYFVGYDT